jgi:hypothetical protein
LLQDGCFGSGCKYPKGHRSHLTLPFVLQNLPGGQGMQDIEPFAVFTYPIGHLWHSALPGKSWYHPFKHWRHFEENIEENIPGTQDKQLACASLG